MSMLLVGLLSAAATRAIGLPSPLALGLIAGITEFIPYVGPVIAAIPAVLVAAIGFIFGPVAVIFAVPITVVLFVLIKKLYVREFLHEQTAIPGEQR